MTTKQPSKGDSLVNSSPAISVKRIWQVDNTTFGIEWSDATQQRWQLCDLQRACPCAACTDEMTGKRLVDPSTIPDDLRAVRITSVGRYALRIQYRSGCSNGIYSYNWLRSKEKAPTSIEAVTP